MNSRCEFSETLVLDELMAPDADQSVRQVYKLFSVLGNSGALDVGEQVAYIRAHDSDWCMRTSRRCFRMRRSRRNLAGPRPAMEVRYFFCQHLCVHRVLPVNDIEPVPAAGQPAGHGALHALA